MRLIDADRLPHKDLSDGKRMCMVVFSSDIASAPTIDAVEVVRCKDCKQGDWYKDATGAWRCYCMYHGTLGHAETDFCSHGERETDG